VPCRQILLVYGYKKLLLQMCERSWLECCCRSHVPGYFWSRNFFFSDSKLSPSTHSVFKSNSPVHAHPMVSGFPLEKLSLRVVRLDTILLRHRIRKYPDSPSTCYRIRCGFLFFHSGERIQKYPDSLPNWIRRMRVDGSRIRKEKVADSKISGYMWTGPKMASRHLCTVQHERFMFSSQEISSLLF